MKETDSKQLAGELVRCMIALATDFSSVTADSLEIDLSPYSALLTQVLAVVASGMLNRESVIKMVHRCNYSLFNHAETEVQTVCL